MAHLDRLTPQMTTRRTWLHHHLTALGMLPVVRHGTLAGRRTRQRADGPVLPQAVCTPPLDDVVHRAVEAAVAAGAAYADARLTRTVSHKYEMGDNGHFAWEEEYLGLGVRSLVQGYWGFASQPLVTLDSVAELAQDSVSQAQENAKGPTRAVDLGHRPPVTGTWTTPLTIDPFHISIEEKLDHIRYWKDCAAGYGYRLRADGGTSWLRFQRQERVFASSEGSHLWQTTYETEGIMQVEYKERGGRFVELAHLDAAGAGWERILGAKIPEQMPERVYAAQSQGGSPGHTLIPGRYTLVLDGATMAALLDRTIGVATQLDRALGHEANASGTSFLDDPLAMVGSYALSVPAVTITANRSAPTQLATVGWDEEGVVPEDCTLVKNGLLHDFQTTREQAAWLAPCYQRRGQPVRSHGYAAAQNALFPAMQMTPNLALAPNPSDARIDDLVRDVTNGILVEGGDIVTMDFQARTGVLGGPMRKITNGRVQGRLQGRAGVLFTSVDLWKQVRSLGGVSTQARIDRPADPVQMVNVLTKGEPQQSASYSVTSVAAIIPNQPVVLL